MTEIFINKTTGEEWVSLREPYNDMLTIRKLPKEEKTNAEYVKELVQSYNCWPLALDIVDAKIKKALNDKS